MTIDEKFDLVDYLIFLRGKLQRLAFRLASMGEDKTQVDKVLKADEALRQHIDRLRVMLMQQWQGDAQQLLGDLRQSNEKAQRHLRELEDAQDRAAKLASILGLIDRGLSAVAGLVP